MTYTMHIEGADGEIRQHPFHLGTIKSVAVIFVLERLAADKSIKSIALRDDGRLVNIYDQRDVYPKEGEKL